MDLRLLNGCSDKNKTFAEVLQSFSVANYGSYTLQNFMFLFSSTREKRKAVSSSVGPSLYYPFLLNSFPFVSVLRTVYVFHLKWITSQSLFASVDADVDWIPLNQCVPIIRHKDTILRLWACVCIILGVTELCKMLRNFTLKVLYMLINWNFDSRETYGSGHNKYPRRGSTLYAWHIQDITHLMRVKGLEI